MNRRLCGLPTGAATPPRVARKRRKGRKNRVLTAFDDGRTTLPAWRTAANRSSTHERIRGRAGLRIGAPGRPARRSGLVGSQIAAPLRPVPSDPRTGIVGPIDRSSGGHSAAPPPPTASSRGRDAGVGRAATRTRRARPARGMWAGLALCPHPPSALSALHCSQHAVIAGANKRGSRRETIAGRRPPKAAESPRNDDSAVFGGRRAVQTAGAARCERARSPDAINPVRAKSQPQGRFTRINNVSTPLGARARPASVTPHCRLRRRQRGAPILP